MKNIMFKDAPIVRPKRNAIDLSHETKLSFNIGYLIPFTWFDVVPGDSFKIRSEVLVKLSPLLAPLLHRMDVYTHYFFVPYRLLMNGVTTTQGGWEEFITDDPDAYYASLELPYVTINNTNKAYFVEGSVADYLGLPSIDSGTTVTQDIDINVLPFYAYHLIYDEYYRDENLENKITAKHAGSTAAVELIGGNQNSNILHVCRTVPYIRAYEKDYFRGALPYAYSGSTTDVELDLMVVGDWTNTSFTYWEDQTDGGNPAAGAPVFSGSSKRITEAGPGNYLTFADGETMPLTSTLEMLELRRAQALTRFLEAQNRGGSRYSEMMLGIYGVVAEDARLQEPQYLGGGKQAVQISSVINQSQVLDPTAGVNDGVGGTPVTVDPQSLETGRGVSAGSTNTCFGYFKEHGIIMGIVSVLPRTAYTGGIERFWHKADRTEFFIPQLQNIGDQEIYYSEVGYDATGTDAYDVWGYAPRWSEYKFKNSTVHGDFRSTLDYWHMGMIHDTAGAGPDLNVGFVYCYQNSDENLRPFANQTVPDSRLYAQIYNDVQAIRPMHLHDIPR